ncbi:hypothetical protein PanWU01x14_041350 [Parasponia andersonii]|uniref:Uncharacterized protein n=1 Tax=Parasponia andersonii TaxID=3476 RepID=A0A2P5DQF4_PARAD|nr:hypothetical protein PanWU01x14_041350 [Parasponia andersonii]
MKIWKRRHSNPRLTRRPRLNPISRSSSNETSSLPSNPLFSKTKTVAIRTRRRHSRRPPETDTRTTREGSRVLMANGYFGLENFGNTCYFGYEFSF